MPIVSRTHQFDEITYKVDGLKVKALQMCPLTKTVKRIVVYLRGGKGQVGRVRAARLIEEVMEVKVEMSLLTLI